MQANHFTSTAVRTGLVLAIIVATFFAPPPNLHAQSSPLTVQPSAGRVGVGNTNPAETLDVNGNIKSSGSLSVGTIAQTGTANRFRHLNSMALAKRIADKSISNATWTLVDWNSEAIDTDTLHDTATTNSRVLAKLTGKYLVLGIIVFEANTTGSRLMTIEKNSAGASNIANTVTLNSVAASTAPGGHAFASAAGIVDMAAQDYVEMFVYQNSGGALLLRGAGWGMTSNLSLYYIGE